MNRLQKRSGQGMTEYIVIIAVVVLAFIAFWPKIGDALKGKANTIGQQIEGAR